MFVHIAILLYCLLSLYVINALDLIEKLYDLYSDKKKTPQITEIVDEGLREELDLKDRLVDPYPEL